MLEGSDIAAVGVETLDAVDDVVITMTDGSKRYEQVKQTSPGPQWTASSLAGQKVAPSFVAQFRRDPRSDLALVTGSDATALREVADRARSAKSNHGADVPAARAEWLARIVAYQGFVQTLLNAIRRRDSSVSDEELFQVLAQVRVADSHGTVEQNRDLAKQRLRLLVGDPQVGLDALEGLVRRSSISRAVIRRADVELALDQGGARPIVGRFSLHVDAASYAAAIRAEAERFDVARAALEANTAQQNSCETSWPRLSTSQRRRPCRRRHRMGHPRRRLLRRHRDLAHLRRPARPCT
jgi:hypothetical protein